MVVVQVHCLEFAALPKLGGNIGDVVVTKTQTTQVGHFSDGLGKARDNILTEGKSLHLR